MNSWRFRGAFTASYTGISSLEFDRTCELLWMADAYGNVTSLLPAGADEVTWNTYSSFRPFPDNPCTHIQFLNDGQESLVAFASQSKIRVTKRGGISVMRFEIPTATQRRLAYFQTDYKSGAIYMGGENPGVQRITLENPELLINSTAEGILSAMKFGDDWLAIGTTGGTLSLRNPTTLEVMHTLKPFVSRVTAVAGEGRQLIASCVERNNTSVVKVFDTRQMGEPVQLISQIGTGSIATLRTYHDKFSNTERAFVVHPQGFVLLQLDQPLPIYSSSTSADGGLATGAVSRNGICAVIGSDKGHLISISNTFAEGFTNLEHPRYPPQPKGTHDGFSWTEKTTNRGQLDSGFDYDVPDEDLASHWPPDNYMILAAEGKLRQINLRITPGQPTVNQWNLTRADVYATDPKDKLSQILLNPFPYNEDVGDDPSRVQQLLQELKKLKRSASRAKGDTNGLYSKQEEALQVCYGNTAQSSFNWQGFNNSRDVVGLDNSLPESWISPLLQCLYLCQAPHFPVRKAITRHICTKEFCVTCETAIIFSNMIITAAHNSAPIAQMGNLVRTMYQTKEFVESGIFTPTANRDHAVAKIHLTQKLLLECFDRDLRMGEEFKFPGMSDPEMDALVVTYFGTEFLASRSIIPPRFYWEVPASAAKVDEGLQHLLKQLESYNGDQVQIKRLPPIIVLLLNPEHGHLKPPSSLKFSRPPKEEFNYVLSGNVLHLADDVDDAGMFVSHHHTADRDNFVLVNDYLVSSPQSEENLESLIPATATHSVVVTCYALDNFKPLRFRDGDRLPNLFEVTGPLLLNDFLGEAIQRSPSQKFHTVLSSIHEINPSDLIALDAEYVVLSWGNKRADEPEWMRRQRKPHMSLARVSCILSSRDGDERTIMDDYVHTPEEVLDYVTQYSGIHEGDLDPRETMQCITTLKATYLKLRALVDRGVRFVGHGLPQDFRVCNIAVPPTQIIDTLELFHKPGHRKLSLRFLAYHLLGERVQEDEHDSVEDARTSLRLYRKYEELTRTNLFDITLERVIQKGHDTNFYVPGEPSAAKVRSPPPAAVVRPTTALAAEPQTDGGSSVAESVKTTPSLEPAETDIALLEGGGLVLDESPLLENGLEVEEGDGDDDNEGEHSDTDDSEEDIGEDTDEDKGDEEAAMPTETTKEGNVENCDEL